MTSQKQKNRARRQAEALMQEAWEALASERHDLACKRSQQSIVLGFVNPRLWKDRGQILVACGATADALEALEKAVALAPGYVEAMKALASLRKAGGEIEGALELLRAAVLRAPDDPELGAALAELEAHERRPQTSMDIGAPPEEPEPATARSQRYDWQEVAVQLRETGLATLPGLVSVAEAASLIALWEDPARFEHEVRADSPERGRVVYRFFGRPLPELVQHLREELYTQLAPIANQWQEWLGRPLRFPRSLARMLWNCAQAGQSRTTPILLNYPAGGFNALHRDHGRNVYFPFQLAVTLEPGADASGSGGELLLADDRRGKLRVRRRVAARAGDGVLFCTRDRLVEIGGALALQPVLHGVSSTGAERWALGIAFHDEK